MMQMTMMQMKKNLMKFKKLRPVKIINPHMIIKMYTGMKLKKQLSRFLKKNQMHLVSLNSLKVETIIIKKPKRKKPKRKIKPRKIKPKRRKTRKIKPRINDLHH